MSAAPLHIIVLAAGAGTRMRSNRPKVLMPLAGRPLLAHVLHAARALGPARIHVVHGHLGEQIRAAFANADDIDWVHQATRNGTGDAVRIALAGIPVDARILVLAGDVPLIRAGSLRALLETDAPLGVLVADLADPHGYGRIVRDPTGRVAAIVEERDCDDAQRAIRTTNSGILAADAARLRAWLGAVRPHNAQGEFYLTDVFALAAADGEPAAIATCDDPDEVLGANDAWQLAALERRYQRRNAMRLALAGVRFADPARFDQRGDLACGSDVEIDVDVLCEGHVELGDGVQIGPFCRLRDVRLAAGTVVHAHCDLDGVATEGPCAIGPFARLRPGTRLAAGTRIGNFVETKNTRLGAGAKANHLTYLGDADIGARVNIGAGTITCNYDGVDKHATRIGDDAFVGSNTAIVAPVTIGAEATIGAGSVLTRDAPAGELSVARAPQRTVPGWKRPKKDQEAG
jgi:bifunctional UDP-N-acetylglucosamine pyrophosphorylase/glucosamine-1-phosphate N-acetyltransferase